MSALSTSTNSHFIRHGVLSRGFTLIEVMLVLVVLSISALVVVLALPSSSEDEIEQQARSLQLRLQLLVDEALLSGDTFGLHIDSDKQQYQWSKLGQDGWQPLVHPQIAAEQQLNDINIELLLGSEDADESWFADSLFEDDDGLFEAGSFESVEAAVATPQIWLSAGGEVTEARVLIYSFQKQSPESANWRVVLMDNGEIALLYPNQTIEQWQEQTHGPQ